MYIRLSRISAVLAEPGVCPKFGLIVEHSAVEQIHVLVGTILTHFFKENVSVVAVIDHFYDIVSREMRCQCQFTYLKLKKTGQ